MDAFLQKRHEAVPRFCLFLEQTYREGKKGAAPGPCAFETDVQGYLDGEGRANPLENLWERSGEMIVLEKVKPCEETSQLGDASVSVEKSAALALSVSRARQLVSFFTMAHNPHMSHLKIDRNSAALRLPLWVRCDRSDPPQTIWMGAEPFSAGNNSTGIILHTITCKGPMSKKTCSTDLENLKAKYRTRHQCSDLTVKGFACYEFLETASLASLSLEDTLISSERNIYANFTWNNVTKVLQVPPLSSVANLNIQMASGSTLSSTTELYRELQFLLNLSRSLQSGTTDWPKPLGQKSAVEVVQKLLKDLKDEVNGLKTANQNHSKSPQDTSSAAYGPVHGFFNRRGDLDFPEQLWSKTCAYIVSYEELVECLTLVMKSLHSSELQAPVHQGSNSLLSKLIKQSYFGSVEAISLTGDAPIRMFLEIGVDKLKGDHFHYFVGKELLMRNHLDYFMSASVDLQEQVRRVEKLHHVLQVVENCVELLKLEQEHLIFLTQSCINYYKENPLNEKYVFQLPVKTAFLKTYYQNAFPQVWRVDISSGQGPKKVRTVWQLSTSPPAEQMNSSLVGLLDETEVCDNKEEMCFATLAECSAVCFD